MGNRKDELCQLDLAEDSSLRDEWHALITHMDAAVQRDHDRSPWQSKQQTQALPLDEGNAVRADKSAARPNQFEVGQRCRVAGYGGVLGTIRFIGHVEGGESTTVKVRATERETHTHTHTHIHTRGNNIYIESPSMCYVMQQTTRQQFSIRV